MIRINLLPIKQDRRREAARNQLLMAFAIVIVEIVIFAAIHMSIDADIETQKNANITVTAEVNRIKKQILGHKDILAEIDDYEKRQAAIAGLLEARTGPVFIMLELSNILSKGGHPTIDNVKYQEMVQLDPTAGYDENWDYRRLWINKFVEKKRLVQISGQALSHEDVAEFLRRINLSDYFVTNELIETSLKKLSLQALKNVTIDKAEPVVAFKLKGEIRYK